MTTLDLKPRSTLSVSVRYRSDGDLDEYVFGKLHLHPHSIQPTDPWSPTVKRHDTLLPLLLPDELQNPQALIGSFLSRTDPRQTAMALHMKFTQADSLPAHMHWEVVREFLLTQVVDAYELPLIMIRHDPFERGFVDAAPPHIHVVVLARRRLLGDWGPTTPLVFDRKWESLVSLWAGRSEPSPA
ncbi:hypothetical protein CHU93_02775 [Sandarakinorhabdus cyanobacteriorum]|uniref:Uncharacterized protein n=1 Tax=Sandarakinorhabdus cyanobacteriorum TaxID=1981098 RepID=A0A255YXM8_9SPHN|nr:hypothetical protein [Sandarakinorhabdus cyanobacteriorum]OYQ33938.1 hypothetical protein CHU93_02775 [Sandarakinorhabdus cyanobacteriorum]